MKCSMKAILTVIAGICLAPSLAFPAINENLFDILFLVPDHKRPFFSRTTVSNSGNGKLEVLVLQNSLKDTNISARANKELRGTKTTRKAAAMLPSIQAVSIDYHPVDRTALRMDEAFYRQLQHVVWEETRYQIDCKSGAVKRLFRTVSSWDGGFSVTYRQPPAETEPGLANVLRIHCQSPLPVEQAGEVIEEPDGGAPVSSVWGGGKQVLVSYARHPVHKAAYQRQVASLDSKGTNAMRKRLTSRGIDELKSARGSYETLTGMFVRVGYLYHVDCGGGTVKLLKKLDLDRKGNALAEQTPEPYRFDLHAVNQPMPLGAWTAVMKACTNLEQKKRFQEAIAKSLDT